MLGQWIYPRIRQSWVDIHVTSSLSHGLFSWYPAEIQCLTICVKTSFPDVQRRRRQTPRQLAVCSECDGAAWGNPPWHGEHRRSSQVTEDSGQGRRAFLLGCGLSQTTHTVQDTTGIWLPVGSCRPSELYSEPFIKVRWVLQKSYGANQYLCWLQAAISDFSSVSVNMSSNYKWQKYGITARLFSRVPLLHVGFNVCGCIAAVVLYLMSCVTHWLSVVDRSPFTVDGRETHQIFTFIKMEPVNSSCLSDLRHAFGSPPLKSPVWRFLY